MLVCACGSNKIENRDTVQCATCNKARIVGERPVVVKERKALAPISASRAVGLRVRAVAYTEVKKEQECCAACGTRYRLTPSHVLTQKTFPLHAGNPRNIVVLCQTDHTLWENHKPQFKLMFPDVWKLKMNIMQELEPAYYQQFLAKHS